MRKIIVKIMQQLVFRLFTEHTPPHVKYSEKNYKAAKAVESLGNLLTPQPNNP